MNPDSATRRRVSGEIAAALQAGMIPWRMPWHGPENAGPPTNSLSGEPFTGIDALLLQLAAQKKGLRSKRWGNAEQWRKLGAKIMCPACAGTEVVGEDQALFNAEQVEGDPPHPRASDTVDYKAAERVIAASGADICHVRGQTAEYRYPPLDYIIFPLKEQFQEGPGGLPGYYESLFHELMHWSEPRLGWKGDYATNELRAEIGSCLVATRLGLPNLTDPRMIRNHARFVGQWIEAMEEDDGLIFKVTASVGEAAEYLLACKGKQDAAA